MANPPQPQSSGRARGERWAALAEWLVRPALFAPLLLALALGVSLWFAQYRVPPSDAGALLTSAAKILRGSVFYRDIDAYPLPGSAYLLALWMGLFGEHLSVARGLAIGVYACIVLSLYATALQLLDRGRAALFGLALLGFKFVAWPGFTSYVYWDVSLAFACIAVALLVRHPARRPGAGLVAAGACVALATLCKQNLGIYLGAAALLLLAFPGATPGVVRTRDERLRALGAFAVGVAIGFAPALLYFGSHGLLSQMLYSGLVRPFTGYLPTSSVSFWEPLEWWRLGQLQGLGAMQYSVEPYWQLLMREVLPAKSLYPAFWTAGEIFVRAIYTSVPVAFLAALGLWVRARKSGRRGEHERLFAFAVLALAITGSAFPRADFTHVVGIYPPVLLLAFAIWARIARGGFARSIELAAVLSFLAALGALSLVHHSHLSRRMTLERADLFVYPDSYVESVVRFVSEETQEGDPLFVYGNDAHYYFLTGRFFGWPFSQLYPGQAGGDRGRRLAGVLHRKRPEYVIRGILSWPGLPSIPAYAPFVERYIRRHYGPDRRVFERYPVPEVGRPPGWVIAVLRDARKDPTGAVGPEASGARSSEAEVSGEAAGASP